MKTMVLQNFGAVNKMHYCLCENGECTGCPKSSFLYFKSLYFSASKANHLNKSCVFQSNSLFLYLLCHLLTRIFELCTSAPKLVRVWEYIFQPFFLYFIARIARTPSLVFAHIKKDINPLNAKTLS